MTKQLLGFDCPGCGIQRSIFLLLEGEFLEAFKMYPAIYTLIALAMVILFNQFVPVKYYQKLLMFLSITSVFLILTNFILKIIH